MKIEHTSQSDYLISVLIPEYNNECFLERCVKSVYTQNFNSLEIVIVNDHSHIFTFRKIIKNIIKECSAWRKNNNFSPVHFVILENQKNEGTLETLRNAFYHSNGKYIMVLESDDVLYPDSLINLCKATENGSFDIVQGNTLNGTFNKDEVFNISEKPRNTKLYSGKRYDSRVLDLWARYETSTVLWGKLFKRKLWYFTFEQIPVTYIVGGNDILISFFLFLYAKSFNGILENVIYYLDGGISNSVYKSVNDFYKIFTEVYAFEIITNFKMYNPNLLTKEQKGLIELKIEYSLFFMLGYLKKCIPEIQPEVTNMIKNAYGTELVGRVLSNMKLGMYNA